ncbi:MAG: carboxylesterase family protein [Amnibacterium sp.]
MRSESSVHPLDTPVGRLLGLRERGVVRFRGIRYATAERFGRPRPAAPPVGEVPALEPAPACPQPVSRGDRMLGDPYRGIGFDEDCLRLSITVPDDLAEDERLPVLVWIHGGSYVAGAGDLPIFDPAALVREQRVVVVAVTFRLGVLGFLGDGAAVPANLGLLDLLEALRWVRAHISVFGGDPAAVTLFGQSAGGDAVAHLLVAGTGLFQRAVIQSAPFGIRRRRGRMTARMLDAVGRLDPAAEEELLFAAHDRAYTAARRFGLRSGMPFGPQYGHDPLPDEAAMDDAWRAVAPSVDVLVGWTAEETAFFGAVSPALTRIFALPFVGALLRRLVVRLTTDAVYRRGGRAFARLLRGAGARLREYELTWRPRGSAARAGHVVDMPLLFPDASAWAGARLLGNEDPADLERLGAGLRAVWGAFARGEPLPSLPPGPVRLTVRERPDPGRRSESSA